MTLSEKYDEIMDRVVVTKEMRGRILENVRKSGAQPEAKVIRFPHWKKYVAAAACFAVLLIGALTVPGLLPSSQENPPVDLQGTDGIVECQSVEELSKTIGFPISDITALPFEPTGTAYISSFGEIAEIDYTGADGQTAAYRKSVGTDDNSGIYDTFPDTEQISVGSVSATLKGDGTAFTLAVWTDGTYSYSVVLSNGVGIDGGRAIIQEIR